MDNVIRSFQSHQFDQEMLLNVPCQVCKMNRNADFRSFKRRGFSITLHLQCRHDVIEFVVVDNTIHHNRPNEK